MDKRDEFDEMIEVLFDNLDIRKWEDSYCPTVIGSSEPNTLYKVTVDDKVEQVRDVVFGYVDYLEGKIKKLTKELKKENFYADKFEKERDAISLSYEGMYNKYDSEIGNNRMKNLIAVLIEEEKER